MKTAKERAIEIVQQMRTNMDIPKHLEDGLAARIAFALKDQDKITRHACAEAIKNNSTSHIINVSIAHQAIMNTKAV